MTIICVRDISGCQTHVHRMHARIPETYIIIIHVYSTNLKDLINQKNQQFFLLLVLLFCQTAFRRTDYIPAAVQSIGNRNEKS